MRNMVRAGVSQPVAMSILGHKTVSMFLRYKITSGTEQRGALERVHAHLTAQPVASNVAALPPTGKGNSYKTITSAPQNAPRGQRQRR